MIMPITAKILSIPTTRNSKLSTILAVEIKDFNKFIIFFTFLNLSEIA